MTGRKQLLYMVATDRRVLSKLLDDINEDESMFRAGGQGNHIRWHIGHLAYFGGYTLSMLGDNSEKFEALKEPFGPGSVLSDDSGAYPPFAQLKEQHSRILDKTDRALELLGDGDLEKPTGPDSDETVWQQVTFTCLHDFYHAGQIAMIRTSLGRERPFG